MISIDQNGNFIVDSNNRLTKAKSPLHQYIESEMRCLQETWAPDPTFGRNVFVWGLSQSVSDRCYDLYRIGSKYMTVQSVSYNEQNKIYEVAAK